VLQLRLAWRWSSSHAEEVGANLASPAAHSPDRGPSRRNTPPARSRIARLLEMSEERGCAQRCPRARSPSTGLRSRLRSILIEWTSRKLIQHFSTNWPVHRQRRAAALPLRWRSRQRGADRHGLQLTSPAALAAAKTICAPPWPRPRPCAAVGHLAKATPAPLPVMAASPA